MTNRQQARLRRRNGKIGDVADKSTGWTSRVCRGLVADVTGKSAQWNFGLTENIQLIKTTATAIPESLLLETGLTWSYNSGNMGW